jgi:Subtilase family/Secretion system C-terminal sorting domain
MKKGLYTLVFLVLAAANMQAQTNYDLKLKSRTIISSENKNLAKADFENIAALQRDFLQKTAVEKNNAQNTTSQSTPYIYMPVQFFDIPTESRKKELEANGITVLSYLGANAYWCSIASEKMLRTPAALGVRNIIALDANDKMSAALALRQIPGYATPKSGTVDICVFLQRNIATSDALAFFKNNTIEIVETPLVFEHQITVRIAQSDLERLASMPIVEYLEPIRPPSAEINHRDRSAINAAFVARPSGLNLTGSGIFVGIGDGGDINHIDYNKRVERKSGRPYSGHATHVAGTLLGEGLIAPRFKGMAPGVPFIVSDYFDRILVNTPDYITNFNMSLTNNSWSSSGLTCPEVGIYSSASAYTDEQLSNNPKLLHVFAAGNSGSTLACTVSGGVNFGSVHENFQVAKNVLTVANTYDTGLIAPSSSRGPTKDGRIKPEIAAIGMDIGSCGFSATVDDNYFTTGGTSMATPAVTGGLALLSERYKALNGVLPDGALLKAIAMNTARDMGNAGPDYLFGYGWLDVRRAEQTISSNTIFTNTVAHAATQTHTISVPVGASALRVMLYWHDPYAAPSASPALVNNLNLTVTTPSASTVLPWILNPAVPSAVATRGIDNANNQEQVTINAPAAGTYTFTVVGTNVPVGGPQKYYVVYEIVQPAITVLYPVGDEKLTTTESEIIRWEATDASANTFTVEYSTNSGSTWTVISSTVAATARQLTWTVPAGLASNQCRIRVTRNSTAMQDQSDADFTIIGEPSLTITNDCPGYATLTWAAITGATNYEIFRINQATGTVTSIGTTAALTYLVGGLVPSQKYYFAVTARTATAVSRRSVAMPITPSGGACSLAAFDNNLELTNINVNNGRKFTSSALGASQTIVFTVTNRDDVAYTGAVTATYQINGGGVVSQSFTVTALAAGANTTLSFSTTANLSAVNTYTMAATIAPAGDTETSNNTKTTVVRQVDNPVLTLPFIENFEGAAAATYTANTFAANGIDRLDYNTPTANSHARLRMNVLPNLARSGSKAMTMDEVVYQAAPSVNEGILTFNLSAVASANLRMDFYFQHHNDEAHPGDMVWIRGNDAAAWLPAYDLFANQGTANTYNGVSAVNIKAILTAAGQVASSSFQVKFGQEGNYGQSPNSSGDGYTFDDIKIYDLVTDLGIKSLDAPTACSIAGSTISITIENTAVTNIIGASLPISYTITPPTGAATTVNEIVNVTLNAGMTMPFSFTTPYTFTQVGEYGFSFNLTNPDDVAPNNMLSQKRVMNQGSVSVFPYIEGFESGTGNWFHNGTNDDWTLGTPAKTIINKAANGTKAWVTKTTGTYTPNQLSYLYSPCFDLTALTTPIMSFSFIHDLEFCPNPGACDWTTLEYSTNGKMWTKLGAQGAAGSTSWHNDAVQGWSNTDNKWHVASLPIPAAAKTAATRFRFVMNADSGVEQEGLAIDDFSIFEQKTIYAAANTVVTQTISGSNWVTFASGGNVIAQINPQGNNLGATDVKSFIFGGALRNNVAQYYMDRNLVIKPTNAPTSPVKIRLFFLKTEIDEAIAGTGCGTCSAPNDAYVLGITKFSGTALNENGTLADNVSPGTTTFILPANTHIQPYDNGYYAEFEVTSFSEFFPNHGGTSGAAPLPVSLLSFNALEKNKDAYLTWATASETNCSHFDVEVANEQQINSSIFKKIGEVRASGTTSSRHDYSFIDKTLDKNGLRYYRLRIVDFDGSQTFSPVVSLRFQHTTNGWALYPNPTKGNFKAVFSADAQSTVIVKLTNAIGQELTSRQAIATGNQQTLVFDDLQNMVSGIYFVTIETENQPLKTFKLVKE